MDILNVDEEEIKKFVEEHYREYGYGEFIYFRCINDIRNVDPCKLKEEDVKGPIRVFLINWMMGRVLGGIYIRLGK